MTAFAYRAARPDGEMVRGVLEAPSRAGAVAELSGTGLLLLDVREEAAGRRRTPVHRVELARAFSGLASLIEAGLPLDRALAVTAETAHARLRPALDGALRRVREGAALSQALDLSHLCPGAVVATIRAGEANGRLHGAVRSAADGLAREAELASQLRAAMAYPLFLLATGTVAVVIIVGFVVPKFASLLGDMGQSLPASTRLLTAISSWVAAGWLYAAAALLTAAVALSRWRSTLPARVLVDRLMLGFPLLGGVLRRIGSARACRTLGDLLQSGVPALSALGYAGAATGNAELEGRMARARGAVSEGQKVWWSLRRHAVLSDSALQLVRFGEESGRLGLLALEAARQEEAAAYRAVRAGIGLLEPVLIVAFGALVAFVALSLLQAVYAVRPGGL